MVLSGANIATAGGRISGPSSRRVFVFDSQARSGSGLLPALGAQGYACADVATELNGLPDRIAEVAPDLVVLVDPGQGERILKAVEAIHDRHACPVVLFSEDGSPERMKTAVASGVSSYVVVGVGENRVRSAIDMAFVQFGATEALKRERDEAKTALAERKLIERAKGIVMRQRATDEGAAFRFLRKTAMDRNLKLGEVAQQIIDAADLLGAGAADNAGEADLIAFSGPPTTAIPDIQPEADGQRRPGGSDG